MAPRGGVALVEARVEEANAAAIARHPPHLQEARALRRAAYWPRTQMNTSDNE